ncbi:MAG: ribosome biogenesis GTPase Der [Acidobacteria bacterium]|nr:MAG: ribosome biogenesis GTPase Der [Acidobacteriota bacterium]REK01112.1 MAG: ribosome biogenesis GTPase Der [Acidobacteriota bacterium]
MSGSGDESASRRGPDAPASTDGDDLEPRSAEESSTPPRPGPARPLVAIVGRPNVGKSTLFNRLIGRRQSIVHDMPGVTRDRIFATLSVEDRGEIELVDTGGLVPGDDPLGLGDQVLAAVRESELLLLVVDGKEGPLPADEAVLAELRRHDKPMILVVNKGDTNLATELFDQFYALGVWPQLLVSAEHGRGIEELLEAVAEQVTFGGQEPFDGPRIAVVGRPNVGKSSLVNRLLGTDRTLVSEVAGTTRDPIDSELVLEDGRRYLLVDTAGIRRRSQMTDAPESIAVLLARRQIEQADVAILVVDASQGITTGDMAIAGSIWELGRGAAVAINKWDLLDEEKRDELELGWQRLSELLSNPPRFNISALTGRRIDRILDGIDPVVQRFELEIGTAQLNKLLEAAIARVQPPSGKGKAGPWKMYYATQVSTGPPTFMLFANRTLDRNDAYRRYLQNSLRAELGLDGVPIRLVVRQRS